MSETQRVETQDPDNIGACKRSRGKRVGNAFAIYKTPDGPVKGAREAGGQGG